MTAEKRIEKLEAKVGKLCEQIVELQDKRCSLIIENASLYSELAEIYEIIWKSETRGEIVSKLKEAVDNGKIQNPNGERATD